MICVTSFHRDHYDSYAKRFLTSWKMYWPQNSKLLIYQQEFDYSDPDSRLEILNFDTCVEEFANFKKKTDQLIETAISEKERNRYVKGLRWSYKIFSLCNAMKNHEDPLIWLDADTETLKRIPQKWDIQLLNGRDCAVHQEPQKKHSAISKKDYIHWETGLFVVGGTQDQRKKMSDKILDLYNSGEIWNRPFIWDGYAWADACEGVMTCFDLWESNPGHRPFGSKYVKKYMRHYAGKAKFLSYDLDSISGRTKENL